MQAAAEELDKVKVRHFNLSWDRQLDNEAHFIIGKALNNFIAADV